MRIAECNSFNNQNFSGHLLKRHVDWFQNIVPKSAEDYFAALGMKAKFRGNQAIAGLNVYAAKIFQKLDLPLPNSVVLKKIHPSRKAIAESLFFPSKRKTDPLKHLAVIYNSSVFSRSLASVSKYMDGRKVYFGTNHFLNIPLHEFLHSSLYRKIEDKFGYWHTKWTDVILKKFSNIDISPFKREIDKKIGSCASDDALELHAVYWAKEICDSLNSDLVPKYNPFKNPKVKLSPLLREFIEKISEADYLGAKKVSARARLAQKA